MMNPLEALKALQNKPNPSPAPMPIPAAAPGDMAARFAALAAMAQQTASATVVPPQASASTPPSTVVPTTPPVVSVPTTTSTPDVSTTPAGVAELLAKFNLKAPTITPSSPGVSVVPPDAPPNATKVAVEQFVAGMTGATQASAPVVAQTPAPTPAPAPVETSAPVRRPPGWKAKLGALGWSEDQIDDMSVDEVRRNIENSMSPPVAVQAQTSSPTPTVVPQMDAVTLSQTFIENFAKLSDAEKLLVAQVTFEPLKSYLPATAASSEDADETPQVDAGLTLYIDCMPGKGTKADQVHFLEDILAPYMRKAAAAENAPHYSLIPFGKGPHYMAAFMMQEPPTGIIVCSTRFPATNACLEVLQPIAARVIRGL